MMPRPPYTRDDAMILGGIVLAILLLIAFARIQGAAGDEPNRIERYVCDHAHYERYEDGSGRLKCGDATMVIVEVTR